MLALRAGVDILPFCANMHWEIVSNYYLVMGKKIASTYERSSAFQASPFVPRKLVSLASIVYKSGLALQASLLEIGGFFKKKKS